MINNVNSNNNANNGNNKNSKSAIMSQTRTDVLTKTQEFFSKCVFSFITLEELF